MKKIVISLGLLLFSCGSVAVDGHYVVDPTTPGHELRGATPNDDLPIHACDPVKKPDGTLSYTCVAFFYADYQKLKEENERLKTELTACQQGKTTR